MDLLFLALFFMFNCFITGLSVVMLIGIPFMEKTLTFLDYLSYLVLILMVIVVWGAFGDASTSYYLTGNIKGG